MFVVLLCSRHLYCYVNVTAANIIYIYIIANHYCSIGYRLKASTKLKTVSKAVNSKECLLSRVFRIYHRHSIQDGNSLKL